MRTAHKILISAGIFLAIFFIVLIIKSQEAEASHCGCLCTGYANACLGTSGCNKQVSSGCTPGQFCCTSAGCGTCSWSCVKRGNTPYLCHTCTPSCQYSGPCDESASNGCGGTCTRDTDGKLCNSGAGSGTGTCVNSACKKNDGQTCTSDSQCVSGVCNNLGKCGKLGDGQPCDRAIECISNFCNSQGTCGKLSGGSTCSVNADCASGVCLASGLCQPLNNGQACTQNSDCLSNNCASGFEWGTI